MISAGERKVSCCVTSVGVALGGREAAVLVMLLAPWIQDVKSSLLERVYGRCPRQEEARTRNTDGLDQLILKT